MPAQKRHRRNQQAPLPEPHARVWQISEVSAVPSLVDDVFDPTRYRPLIVISEANDTRRTRVNVESLTTRVGEDVNIAVLSAGAPSWAFSEATPDHFHAYGGGVRIYWPYATRDDDDRHPLFITPTEADSVRTVAKIIGALQDRGYLPEPEAKVFTAPWAAADEPEGHNEKVDRLLSDLAAAQEKIAALSSENVDLKRAVHGLTDQAETLQQRLHHTRLFVDPDRQLRHEIEYAWLLTYPEPERDEHPLTSYTFGPDFLESVETLEGVERDKVVSACLDVLTRRAWDVHGRKARQFRETAAGGSPARTRADGSTAWRCNIQSGTAAARRLMWWEVPDASIELAVVATHDDMDIR